MTTVIVDRLPETLKNLNSSTLQTSGAYALATDGLYALINDMISNLSSIKASIKVEEKKIAADLATEITAGAALAANDTIASATVTAATVVESTSGTRGDTYAGGATPTLAETKVNVAVLTVGTEKYSEAAVFSVLAQAGRAIRDLKVGTVDNFAHSDYTNIDLIKGS
tara:strand:+ start:64 stop:567 length:504 start_codon:yes stop_codon:yes gene_type:complete